MAMTFVCPVDDCDGEAWKVVGTIRGQTPVVSAVECTDCGNREPVTAANGTPDDVADAVERGELP